jgi:hypothetical protein
VPAEPGTPGPRRIGTGVTVCGIAERAAALMGPEAATASGA